MKKVWSLYIYAHAHVQVKCHQYWPEVGSMNMGDITIMLVEVQELAYYTIRTLRLTKVGVVM